MVGDPISLNLGYFRVFILDKGGKPISYQPFSLETFFFAPYGLSRLKQNSCPCFNGDYVLCN